jgi:hypothetical protein
VFLPCATCSLSPGSAGGEGWGEGAGCSQEHYPQRRFAPGKRCAASRQLFGPLGSRVRFGRSGPVGGLGKDAESFSTGQGCPVEKPGQASRSEGRRTRGVLSLVIFLWTSKESNSATGRSAKHPAGDFLARTLGQSDARSRDNQKPKPLGPRLRGDDNIGRVEINQVSHELHDNIEHPALTRAHSGRRPANRSIPG